MKRKIRIFAIKNEELLYRIELGFVAFLGLLGSVAFFVALVYAIYSSV